MNATINTRPDVATPKKINFNLLGPISIVLNFFFENFLLKLITGLLEWKINKRFYFLHNSLKPYSTGKW